MSRRHTARSGGRWQSVAGFLLIVAMGLVALYVWRGMQASPSRILPVAYQTPTAEHRSPPPGTGEEFSEAERHDLEEILRQHGAGQSR